MNKPETPEELMLQIVLGRLTLACILHQGQYTRIMFTELQNSVIRGFKKYLFGPEALAVELNARIDAIETGSTSNSFWAFDQVDDEKWELLSVVPGYFKQSNHCITFMAPSREEAEIVVKEKIIPYLTAS